MRIHDLRYIIVVIALFALIIVVCGVHGENEQIDVTPPEITGISKFRVDRQALNQKGLVVDFTDPIQKCQVAVFDKEGNRYPWITILTNKNMTVKLRPVPGQGGQIKEDGTALTFELRYVIDEVPIFDRALTEKEIKIKLVADTLSGVEPSGNSVATWGHVKAK